MNDRKLYLEIPIKTNKIDITGEGFIIKNIRILKVLEGEEFSSNENLKKIEIK